MNSKFFISSDVFKMSFCEYYNPAYPYNPDFLSLKNGCAHAFEQNSPAAIKGMLKVYALNGKMISKKYHK